MSETPGPKKLEHVWPLPGEHLFNKWQAQNTTTQYRVCIHPECRKVEYRAVPKA